MASVIGDTISDRIRADGIYERAILEFLRDRLINRLEAATEVAIDVGANIGNHSLFLSDIFARVIAFEPNPLANSLLKLNVEINRASNIDIRPVGLSDESSCGELHFERANLGAATLASSAVPVARSDARADVTLVRGDDSIGTHPRVALIKVDVEGAEEAALKGLEQTIRAHMPLIMIEQLPDAIDTKTGTSPSDSFLRQLGYDGWEIRRARLYAGKVGRIASLLFGREDYVLKPVNRLEKREYPALIFTPPSYVFPPRS